MLYRIRQFVRGMFGAGGCQRPLLMLVLAVALAVLILAMAARPL